MARFERWPETTLLVGACVIRALAEPPSRGVNALKREQSRMLPPARQTRVSNHLDAVGSSSFPEPARFGRGLRAGPDPKSDDPPEHPTGHGPQGDAIRINNFVRLVR